MAPNAENVSVAGDFNGWNIESHPLKAREDESSVWEGFILGIKQGDIYKYRIHSRYNNYKVDKGDPFAFYWEQPLKRLPWYGGLIMNGAIVRWMENRHKHNFSECPLSIYEVHIGLMEKIA